MSKMVQGSVAFAFLSLLLLALAVSASATPVSPPPLPLVYDTLRSPASNSNYVGGPPVPSTGVIRVLAIPVEFTDFKHQRTFDYLQNSLKQVAAYWHEVSYGQLTVQYKVVEEWIALAGTYSQYAASPDQTGFLNDAIHASQSVDISGYNMIIFMRAGHDASLTLNTSDMQNVASRGTMPVTNSQGTYNVAVSSVSEDEPIGPIAHQMGHGLGLPELWDLAILKSSCAYCDDFVGEFDLMGHGFWAHNGTVPAEPSAWTRIELGWLGGPQIITAKSGVQGEAVLNPIESNNGTLVIKIPTGTQTYYLVEVRKRASYDLYLPDEGVIMYLVDDSRGDGLGPVRLVPENGTNVSQATQIAWRPGEFLKDPSNGVLVYVKAEKNGAYTIFYAKGMPEQAAELHELKLTSDYRGLEVKVDGNTNTISNESLSLSLTWGAHQLWIQPTLNLEAGKRAVFAGWSDGDQNNPRLVVVMSDTTIRANFQTQFYLTIDSAVPLNGTGWYNANTTALLKLAPTVSFANRTRTIFTGWTGAYTGNRSVVSVLMSQPKTVTANWKVQYNITINSKYGDPVGSGWYDASSAATIAVTTPYALNDGVRAVFTGWAGDSVETTPKMTIMVSKPITLTAQWTVQNLVFLRLVDANGQPLNATGLAVGFRTSAGAVALNATSEGTWVNSGSYALDSVMWHGASIAGPGATYTTSPRAVWRIPLNVYSLQINVKSLLTGVPVTGSAVSMLLPDRTLLSATSDSNGTVTFTQMPAGQYAILANYQFIQWSMSITLDRSSQVDLKMIVLPELVLVIICLIGALAVVAKLLVAKEVKNRQQKTSLISEIIEAPSTNQGVSFADGDEAKPIDFDAQPLKTDDEQYF